MIFTFSFQNSAKAVVTGSPSYRNIKGLFTFTQTNNGVIVTAKVYGLPTSNLKCNNRIFAVHIHEGTSCSGTMDNPFANAMTHYNPNNCKHPHHAGDLEPLFENGGYAYYKFLTNRFTVKEIIGKTLIIHENPDDFTTQPSGNSGKKIACGVIK